jgi:hypothetical protein
MPQPEGSGLTQAFSPRLTNMAIGYLPGMTEFIGDKIFPAVPVGAQAGEYNIFPRGEFLRVQGKKLANNEAPPLGTFNFSKGNYTVDEYGLSANWTQRDLNAAAVGGIGAGKLKSMKTQFVTFQARLSMEIDMAAVVRTSGNWTTNQTGVSSGPSTNQFIQWDQSTSDPVTNVKAWKEVMRLATGFVPNKMQLSQAAINALSEHPDIIDRVKYTGGNNSPAKVNKAALTELFEVDEIVVSLAVKNTANEGAADAISDIWGKDGFLWYTPGAPSMELPSAGYRFNWVAGMDSDAVGPQPWGRGLNGEGLYINNYTTDRPAAEWVESRWYTVPKVTGAGLGMLLIGVTA